jgi:CoA:oxalate CoA-transferase
MITEIDHPKAGKFKLVNSPFKFSRTPSKAQGFAPELGQDTEEVLRKLLKMNPREIEKLRKSGIIR